MNTLKPNLKILTKIILISLFFSCATLEVDSVSTDIERVQSVESTNLAIAVLPVLEPELRSFEISGENNSVAPEQGDKFGIVLLEYDEPQILTVSSEIAIGKDKEILLTSLNVVSRPKINNTIVNKKIENNVEILKPVDKNTLAAKEVVEKKAVEKKVEPVKIVSVPKKKENIKVVAKAVKVEPVKENKKNPENIIEKPLVLGVPGKSFTIEMDQTGWIYEKEIQGLKFKNKFYTSDRVLFEFQAEKKGKFEIQFTKYTDGNKSITKVPVEISNKTAVKNRESEVIKPSQTVKSISVKEDLEKKLTNIDLQNNPDEVYFKLAGIYLEEGYIKKSKEFYEYIYDNYPLSSYYDEAKIKMDYILDNFLLVR